MAKKKKKETEDVPDDFVNEPSSLDDNTHAEMITLYKESTETIRFAKHMQWWTVGSTLLAYGAMVGIAKLVGADKGYADLLTWVIILTTLSVIFTLTVYQFWQHTENQKITEINHHMSSLFGRVRYLKSSNEANIHRYLLLVFMVVTVVLGAVVSQFALVRILAQQ